MGLAAGLVLALPSTLQAQRTGPMPTTGQGLPMSSGSGTGNETGSITGTGGVSTTGSGSTITGGPAGTRMGSQGFGTGAVGPGGRSVGGAPWMGLGRSPNFGPGGGAHFPDDPALIPFEALTSSGPEDPSGLSSVPPSLLRQARSIPDLAERAMALQRLANAAIFSNELTEAHHALTEASKSALNVEQPLVRDQRLIAIVTTLLSLAEAHLREGKGDTLIEEVAEALPPTSSKVDRDKLIRRAELEWKRAAYLAARITNPTYRSELIYRVVDGQSYGTQTIAKDFPLAGSRPGVKEPSESYDVIAERILRSAASEAETIERPVWRDRALVEVAVNAAGAQLFRVALEVVRRIPQPEVRVDGLVRIAEIQATKSTHPEQATGTYEEAAQAVASIPLDDPRAVLAGVLIDNLISVGRFDDARASVGLYPDIERQMIALGAVAEAQGRRGSADAARKWIAEVPEPHRAVLYRKVVDGIIYAIDQNRNQALSQKP
jgi:hypothetical protein